jgi:hypothetical protein
MDKSIENNPMNHAIFAGHLELTSSVAKKFDCELLKKTQRQMIKMECWSRGVLEYWVLNALFHYSITPVFQSSALERGD